MRKIEDIIRESDNIEAVCDSEMKNLVQEAKQGEKIEEVLLAPSPGNTAPTSPDSLLYGTSYFNSTFEGVQFRANMKVLGRLKRPVRQLCFFNIAVADKESNTQMKTK